ncbi:tetratricopeptide repeat protein [Roseovarius gahaiensis]|uniref:Tetratricopeptide repeat protein n=2 Tax=Roseovarius gahaiensis TaxID=2716691 RepID=A0A967EJ96_9RHOB|nr:tetratricopeptide repeat protein [Roseovarius gahaiensis]
MSVKHPYLNRIVAAGFAVVMFSLPATGQNPARLDDLFDRLEQAEPADARRAARDIEHAWAQSGSAAMDLLLGRGRDALEAGDSQAAIEHFSALIDHAPDFAEGWHMRSVAFSRVGRYGLALADIEQALALNPRHFNAIHGLGVILEELNQPDLAHRAFTRVLAIHPHHEAVTKALERLGSQVGGSEL